MNGEKSTETAVAVRSVSALPIANMGDLAQAGQFLAASGIFGIKNAAAGFCVAATCHQQGISLMEFRRTYHMTDEGPSMRADAMAAEFRNRGGRYEIVENSTERAAARFEFEDQDIEFSYSMDDARRTGDCFKGDGKTLKHNWLKRPEDMLWARMVSRAVRRLCPEINSGLYAPEEMADGDGGGSRPPMRVLTTEEVQERVASARTVDATPKPSAILDCTRVPEGFGDVSGHPWAELADDMLAAALESPDLDAGYKAAIRLVVDERKGVVA
jgi:hypothetical protein